MGGLHAAGQQQPVRHQALASQEAVESLTCEVVNGEPITARSRKFRSMSEAFDQHGELLATSRHYTGAMLLVQDPDAFADALTGIDATDPQYGCTLKWVMNSYGFKKFDP